MAYANAHIQLRFGGHFGVSATEGAEADHWSTGLRLGIVGADVPYNATALQTLVEACLDAATSFHASNQSGVGSSCFIGWATAARVGTDGKYLPASALTARKDQTPVAGVGTPHLPWNTALVISLRTDKPRGHASNGRVYWPAVSIALNAADGRVTPSLVDSRLVQFTSLMAGVNAAATAYAQNMRVVVASNVGDGEMRVVTAVRSDTRLDSIERRENAQPPNWITKTNVGP